MSDPTEYERDIAPIIADMHDRVLRLEARIGSAGPSPHADYEAAELERMRRTLGDVRLNVSALTAAWQEGYAERRDEAAAACKVIPLRPPRAITA